MILVLCIPYIVTVYSEYMESRKRTKSGINIYRDFFFRSGGGFGVRAGGGYSIFPALSLAIWMSHRA